MCGGGGGGGLSGVVKHNVNLISAISLISFTILIKSSYI